MFFFISKLESFGTHSFEENVCLIDHFSNCFYQYLHWYKYMYMYCIIHEQITDTSWTSRHDAMSWIFYQPMSLPISLHKSQCFLPLVLSSVLFDRAVCNNRKKKSTTMSVLTEIIRTPPLLCFGHVWNILFIPLLYTLWKW